MSWLHEANCDYAVAYGSLNPEVPWILTPLDTWLPNPFYNGPPAPHPEEQDPEETLNDED